MTMTAGIWSKCWCLVLSVTEHELNKQDLQFVLCILQLYALFVTYSLLYAAVHCVFGVVS
jgi:hypothetical protein